MDEITEIEINDVLKNWSCDDGLNHTKLNAMGYKDARIKEICNFIYESV